MGDEADEGDDGSDAAGRHDGGARKRLGALGWTVLGAVLVALATGIVSLFLANLHRYDVVTNYNRDSINSENFEGGAYLVDRPIQDVGPPPNDADSCAGRYLWAHAMGAIDVDSTGLQVSVSAADGHAVQVVGAHVVAAGDPRSPGVGSDLTCPGGGAEPVNLVQVDLESGAVLYFEKKGEDPVPLNIAVEPGKTAVFDVVAGNSQRERTYYIDLDLRVDGRAETARLDRDGQPFVTGPSSNAKKYRWIGGAWVDSSSAQAAPLPDVSGIGPVSPACSLISSSDVSGIMGSSFNADNGDAVQAATSGTGRAIRTSMCLFGTSAMDSVQVSVIGSPTEDDARKEFEFALDHIDNGGAAEDLAGYSDVKVVDGNTVLARRGTHVVMVSIVRHANKVDPFDRARVEKVFSIVSSRY